MYHRHTPESDINASYLPSDAVRSSEDHWMLRISIMTILAGVGIIFSSYNISRTTESFSSQIALTGLCVAIVGAISWLITRHFLKGSKNESN